LKSGPPGVIFPDKPVATAGAVTPGRALFFTLISKWQAGSEEKGREMEKFPMTLAGYQKLEADLKKLKQEERPAIIQAIAEARSHGDLSENAEYHAAKERQGWIESQILELEDKFTRAQVIDVTKLNGATVKFGATITLIDEDSEEKKIWQIVGEIEADVKERKISVSSPIARAVIGKAKGDVVEVTAPGGARSFEIAKVEFK
jgi:transcription elongation factor GreA